MKSKFLTAVAAIALVASGVVAKAQEAPKHDERPAAQRVEPRAEPAPKAAQMERRDEPMKGEAVAPKAAQTERRNEPMRGEAVEPKAAETDRKMAPKQTGEQPRAAQTEERNRPAQQGETGTMKPASAQRDQKRMAEPNGAQPAARTGENENTRNAPQTAERPAANGHPRVIGKVDTSQEHATRVGELLQHNARRERVDFGIEVGARVPETVVISPLPAEVLAFAPEYRGYDYFVDSNDEIVFVSPETHEIVGAIEYEGRAADEDSSVHVAGARPCPVEN